MEFKCKVAEELSVVGGNVTRLDAVEKATGKANFAADFRMSGMLYAKVLRSPHPHARILSIDANKAKRLPGVKAVLTASDVPKVTIAPLLSDQYALCCDNVVRFVGDPVAAVAADTLETAEEALTLIKVRYEELPAVFDAEEAFSIEPHVIVHRGLSEYKSLTNLPICRDPQRPNVCQTYRIRSGDVKKGFQQAGLVVENRFTTARIQQCPLEPHMADAWFEPDGNLTVRSTCQVPHLLAPALCRLFQLPSSRVRILSAYIGGAFGGATWVRAEAIAALLARESGKPVRLVYTREEMFVCGGHRVPYIVDIKDGVRKDGTLIAREIRTLLALGAYSENAILMVSRATSAAIGTYRVPNFRLDSYGVYTNEPLTAPFRGFGCPEIEWAIEQQMDMIAEKLGIDPIDIRRRNILNNGERDAGGMITHSIGVRECLDKVVEWISWNEKPIKEIEPWKRGKGIAIGNKSLLGGSSSVIIVRVGQDGKIEVRTGATEIGQGIMTCLAQIAAEEFSISVDRIKVVSGDTIFCPFDFGTVASRSLFHNGNALIIACKDAKRQLYEMAGLKLGISPDDLATANGKIYAKVTPERSLKIEDLFTPAGVPPEKREILASGSYTGPLMPVEPDTGQSERYVIDYSHAACAVEVAVNVETGEIRILKSVLACDVGRAINPKVVEAQIEGGMGMGIGSAIYEEVALDNGAVVNPTLVDYRIPTTGDIPSGENNESMIVEIADEEGPFGAKGVGELPLVAVAPAIANAVYNAVGVRIRDLPLSKEKVLEGIKKRKEG